MITRQCVILVGGLGTRLGELTRHAPKPLLPVGGAPFLEILLREAARRGFDDLVLLAGHGADDIERYLEQSAIATRLNIEIRVSREPRPLGTGGALAYASSLLSDNFLLINGDTWFDFNWLDFVHKAAQTPCLAAMALRRIEIADRYETVKLSQDRITAFRPRDVNTRDSLINGGVYWVRREAIKRFTGATSSMEAELLPELCERSLLGGWIYDGFFLDIGIPETYSAAQKLVPAQCNRPAVFLDRDGVLNVDSGYAHLPEEIIWVEGAKLAVKFLNDAGFFVFVVTNQAGIGHGHYDEANFHALRQWMTAEMRETGAAIDDWRFSPYHPEAKLPQFRMVHDWRKPGPGMINDLFACWPADRKRSFLIGDKETDIAAANAAGIPGYLFKQGDLAAFAKEITDRINRAV